MYAHPPDASSRGVPERAEVLRGPLPRTGPLAPGHGVSASYVQPRRCKLSAASSRHQPSGRLLSALQMMNDSRVLARCFYL